jgi:hypothetical protein
MSELIDTNIVADELYEERQFTDLKAGGIKSFWPVKPDGTPDESRDPVFVAVTNIETGQGLFPVHGKVEDCSTLEQALVDFKVTLEGTLQDMMDAAEQREREQQGNDGRIITLDEVNPQA